MYEEIKKLTKKELQKAIVVYDQYVINFPEDHEEGDYPVCFMEWLDNDYIKN